jgi:hypothetical protein
MALSITQKLWADDAQTRKEAIVELGVTGGRDTISHLEELSSSSDPAIVYFAKKSIAQIKYRCSLTTKATEKPSVIAPIDKKRYFKQARIRRFSPDFARIGDAETGGTLAVNFPLVFSAFVLETSPRLLGGVLAALGLTMMLTTMISPILFSH